MTEREALNARLARQNKLLKQREEELEAQNTRFNAAINNMSQGLCLFNSEQRVMFANRRFAEIYNLDPEQVKPGTTLRQILEARVARGAYSNIDGAKFVADGVASFGQAVSQIIHLADGRFISVLRRPMPDGGVVSTHEDITEREKLKARLEQQNEQLDAAMNNMSQGLAMYDREQRLVICNKDYADDVRPDPASRFGPARRSARSWKLAWPTAATSLRTRASSRTSSSPNSARSQLRCMSSPTGASSTSPIVRRRTAATSSRTRTSPTSAARRPRSCTWRCTTR